MGYTFNTVKELLSLGANVVVSEGGYTGNSLREFAELAKANNCQLTIKKSSYTSETLKDLIRIAKGHVTIEV